MCHVDALSRNPILIGEEVLNVDLTEADWLLAAQMQDDAVSAIRRILEEESKNRENKQYFENYELKNGKVYRKLNKK